jgi:hypothetical protein
LPGCGLPTFTHLSNELSTTPHTILAPESPAESVVASGVVAPAVVAAYRSAGIFA